MDALQRAIHSARCQCTPSYIRGRVEAFERRLTRESHERLAALQAQVPPRPKRPPSPRVAKDARYYYKPGNHLRQLMYRQLKWLAERR